MALFVFQGFHIKHPGYLGHRYSTDKTIQVRLNKFAPNSSSCLVRKMMTPECMSYICVVGLKFRVFFSCFSLFSVGPE